MTHAQLFPSPRLNILSLSFTKILNCKFYISPLGKFASIKLGVVSCSVILFTLSIAFYRGLFHLRMEYDSHVLGASPTELSSKGWK